MNAFSELHRKPVPAYIENTNYTEYQKVKMGKQNSELGPRFAGYPFCKGNRALGESQGKDCRPATQNKGTLYVALCAPTN